MAVSHANGRTSGQETGLSWSASSCALVVSRVQGWPRNGAFRRTKCTCRGNPLEYHRMLPERSLHHSSHPDPLSPLPPGARRPVRPTAAARPAMPCSPPRSPRRPVRTNRAGRRARPLDGSGGLCPRARLRETQAGDGGRELWVSCGGSAVVARRRKAEQLGQNGQKRCAGSGAWTWRPAPGFRPGYRVPCGLPGSVRVTGSGPPGSVRRVSVAGVAAPALGRCAGASRCRCRAVPVPVGVGRCRRWCRRVFVGRFRRYAG